MRFGDYVAFYGALFFVVGIAAYFIEHKFNGTFSEDFWTAHIFLGGILMVSCVANGLVNFGLWVMHFFK